MKIKYLKTGAKKGFSFLAGINRPVTPSHVTKLAKSVELLGVIRPVIVAKLPFIGMETYIIDGQHLYTACIKLSIDIPYISINIKDKAHLIEVIAKLNASSKTWSLDDYITAWGSINNDYKILAETKVIYDMEISQIATVFMERNVGTLGGHINTLIKRGEFRVINSNRALQTLDICSQVLSVLPTMDRFSSRAFLGTFIEKYRAWGKNYNHKVFMEFLKKNRNLLILATQDQNEVAKILERAIK